MNSFQVFLKYIVTIYRRQYKVKVLYYVNIEKKILINA